MLAAASWWESGSAVFVAAPTLELGAVVDGRRHLDGALLVQQQRGAQLLFSAGARSCGTLTQMSWQLQTRAARSAQEEMVR